MTQFYQWFVSVPAPCSVMYGTPQWPLLSTTRDTLNSIVLAPMSAIFAEDDDVPTWTSFVFITNEGCQR